MTLLPLEALAPTCLSTQEDWGIITSGQAGFINHLFVSFDPSPRESQGSCFGLNHAFPVRELRHQFGMGGLGRVRGQPKSWTHRGV